MALSETAPVADMDIDMDLDLGPEPEPEPIQIQVAPASNLDTTVDPLTEEAVYEKVHVRGVDEMTTENIKQFARDCSGQEPLASKLWLPSPKSPKKKTLRSAVKSDRKQARAHEKSRFYLMHPEHDPRERLRQEFKERRRDDDGGDGDYSRRRFDDREHRRRRDRDDGENFSADMYGDNVGSGGSGRDRRGRGHSQRELLPDADRARGRLRNRSASPGRDTLEEELSKRESQDTGRRFRERSPRQPRRNQGRELLAAGSESTSGNRELFPNKTTSSYIKKDLIPTKPSNHRRSDAFDASRVPDEGARIRGAARASGEDQGFAIRGGASQGLSIKGKGESVRELFPSKYGNDNSNNAGKELFNDTLEGRGGRRRRAEDMFS
ncbi:Protein of unknown function DUF2414 [Penicillium brevicompactum]|uniref:Uncharacterized protein n=1 Tax=Penicillium brevicompactum TaxID=5074 RepID=A0A9W9QKU5_PENBR|nr:Protein of unknown function DUF2414 [Penicillium brevicompactum]